MLCVIGLRFIVWRLDDRIWVFCCFFVVVVFDCGLYVFIVVLVECICVMVFVF